MANINPKARPAETVTGATALVLMAINAFGEWRLTQDQELVVMAALGALPAAITWLVNLFRKA